MPRLAPVKPRCNAYNAEMSPDGGQSGRCTRSQSACRPKPDADAVEGQRYGRRPERQ